MTSPTFQPSYQSFLGIALETTEGTYVAPTNFIPVTKFSFTPLVKMLEDKGYRGAPVDVYNEVAGVLGTNYSYDGDVFADTIGFPLVGVLGTDDVTGTTAPYTHLITDYNGTNFQPPSYSLTDDYAAQCRGIPGLKYDEVTFNFTVDGMFSYTTKGQGWASAEQSVPSKSFSTLAPQAAWICAFKIGGSTSSLLIDASITIKRNVNPVYTATNSQNPATIWGGNVMVEGKATYVMQDDAELNRYLTDTTTSLSFDFSQGVGAAAQQVKFVMSKVQYLSGTPDRSKDYVALPITFKGLANTTDIGASSGYSPVAVTLKNAVAGGTFHS